MEKKKKKFKLVDAILATVCITLVAESVAPTASIGNSQYFWWIFLIIAFVLPYGMISAELGTAYPSEGGMYDWVKKAFGPKWAGRVAWNYWINFPLWIASLAVMITTVITSVQSRYLSREADALVSAASPYGKNKKINIIHNHSKNIPTFAANLMLWEKKRIHLS